MTSHPQPASTGSVSTLSDSDLSLEQESLRSGRITPVLDKGFVALEQHVGGDLSVVNSARVSFEVKHTQIEDNDSGLISYLLKHKHGTPFEHNLFTFNVRLPLFVAREWIRHRIGSFNEVSMRYTKVDPEFYIPTPEHVRVRVGKPGQYTYEKADPLMAARFIRTLTDESMEAGDEYSWWVDKVAPEQARMFLPVNVYTQWYWTVNARALMNFLSLRNAPTAQWEIQQYAKAVEEIFKACMPLTSTWFELHGRVAP